MHIGLLTSEFPPEKHGGVGTLMYELATGLRDAGHAVTVLLLGKGKTSGVSVSEYQLHDVPVKRISIAPPKWLRWRAGELWVRYQLNRLIRRTHRHSAFSALFANEGDAFFPFGAPSGIPLVTALEGTEYLFHEEMDLPRENEFLFNLQRRSMEKSRILVANSHYTAKAIPACYRLAHRNIRIIYHSVDTELFSPPTPPSKEAGLIVFANSIEPRKGVIELLEAMKLLDEEFPQARLVLAGRDVKTSATGEPLSAFLWNALPPTVRERVAFVGSLERKTALLSLLRKAHVCCYPSHIETFGFAPAEAMSLGKPVIFSRTGPGPELIEDGVSGLLCDPKSPASIAGCIRRILNDDAFASTIGANARRKVLLTFAKTKWIREKVALFEEISKSEMAR